MEARNALVMVVLVPASKPKDQKAFDYRDWYLICGRHNAHFALASITAMMLQNHVDAGQLNVTTHPIHFNQRSEAPPTLHPSLPPNRKGPETTCHVRVGKCGSLNLVEEA